MAWLAGFFIGFITPGRVGDITRSYYLKDRLSLGKSITTVVVDRAMDILILLLIAVINIFAFFVVFTGRSFVAPILAVLVIFVALAFAATRKSLVKSLLKPLFTRFVPEKYKSNLSGLFSEFYAGLDGIMRSRKRLAASFVLSILYWLVSIFQYLVFATALGISVSYGFLLMAMPVVILLDMLPVSFSGLGTREAALIYFLSLVAVGAELALSYSLVLFFFNYVLLAAGGLLFWVLRPPKSG